MGKITLEVTTMTPEAVLEAACLYALEHSVDDDSILLCVREYLETAE